MMDESDEYEIDLIGFVYDDGVCGRIKLSVSCNSTGVLEAIVRKLRQKSSVHHGQPWPIGSSKEAKGPARIL